MTHNSNRTWVSHSTYPFAVDLSVYDFSPLLHLDVSSASRPTCVYFQLLLFMLCMWMAIGTDQRHWPPSMSSVVIACLAAYKSHPIPCYHELQSLKTFFQLLFTCSASNAADGLHSNQEALAPIDEMASPDQFITKGQHTAGPNETFILKGCVPDMGHAVTQHLKDGLGMGVTIKTENGNVKNGQHAYEEE